MRRYLAARRPVVARASPSAGLPALRPYHTEQEYNQSESSNTALQHRHKAYTAVFSEDLPDNPYLYHVVTPRNKRGKRPRPLRDDEVFELPNLVLDLDAYGAKNVREFNPDDEMRLQEIWALSEKRKAVRLRLHAFQQMIQASRSADQALLDPANPWRINPHDVVSAAMLGLENSAAAEQSAWSPENAPATPRISRITQAHVEHISGTASTPSKPWTKTESPHDGNDQSRSVNVLEKVRLENGIPLHSTDSRSHFLRWMMVRREKLESGKREGHALLPAASEIIQALRDQKGPTGISGIRRLVFQSIASGIDLQQIDNCPQEIRSACVKILDECPSTSLHKDTLIFTSNLIHRLPYLSPPMKACILGLRLRCLAKLGLLDLTTAQLQHGSPWGEIRDSGANIVDDINAALQSWNAKSKLHKTLEHAQQRRLLFRIVTGMAGDADAIVSFRAMLFSPYNMGALASRATQLKAYGEFIQLLAQLGAARTIWAEWRAHDFPRPSVSKESEAPAEIMTQEAAQILDIFSRATGTLLSKFPSQTIRETENLKDLDIITCQALDYESITDRAGVFEQEYSQDWEERLKGMDLINMLQASLREWLDTVEKLCQR